MIVDWTGHRSATAEGIYPGGPERRPRPPPWYSDQMADWLGRPLPAGAAGGRGSGRARSGGTSRLPGSDAAWG